MVQNYLNELTDFSNVGLSSQYSCYDKPLPSCRQQSYEQQLDFNNHSRLLDQFRRLRQKLRLESKRSHNIKVQWQKSCKKYEDKIAKMQNKQIESQSTLKYLKRQIETIHQGIDNLKSRNTQLQKQLLSKNQKQHQINELTNKINQINLQKQQLILQKQKIKQIVLLEKLELEKKMNQLLTINDVDAVHYQQMENDLKKSKQFSIALQQKVQQLQNQQKILSQNKKFKQQQLEKENLELKKEVIEYKRMYEQEKNKRKKNESVGSKKQQLASLYYLQNEAQQRQINQLKRRVEKLTDRYQIKSVQAQCEAFKTMQTLTKLYKSIDIAEDLIHRLKRQYPLAEDIQKLIKVSQYKLIKIKQSQNKGCSSKNNLSPISLSTSKKKQKSRSRSRSKSPTLITKRNLNFNQNQILTYSTPKLLQLNDLTQTFTDVKTIQDKVRKEMRQKENELRAQLQFHKYNKKVLL